MDELRKNPDKSDGHDQFIDRDSSDFLGFDCRKNLTPQGLLDSLKFCFFKCVTEGSDKAFFNDEKVAHFALNQSSPVKFSKNSCICCSEYCENPSKKKAPAFIKSELVDDEFDRVTKKPDLNLGSPILSLLTFFTILTMRSIEFHFSLMKCFLTVPIWFSYFSFMFLMFPLHTFFRIRRYVIKTLWKVWTGSCSSVTTFVTDQFNGNSSSVKLATRLRRGLFWSMYVGSVLFGLFVLGFVIGGLAMRQVVEEPIEMREDLNFDFSQTSPVVFVPIMSSFMELGKVASSRFIPYKRRFHMTLSMVLPESDYNRQLGVFQVRMELLSANGKVTATSTYPSMLRFKSQPIRVMETLFKSVQVITGFHSESQVLDIKMSNFVEGLEPTACFKITLEQRAEFKLGAGIPEIYGSSLVLESELPKLKHLIWSWRRTVFVWVSIMTFLTELMFVLVFFRTIFIGTRSNNLSIIATKQYSISSPKCI